MTDTAEYAADAATVAEHNDAFRRQACRAAPGMARAADGRPLRGRVVWTAAVAARGPVFPLLCLAAVETHETFDPENDPEGHHDFGAVEVGGERVWFKIDAYDDAKMQYGSEAPDDPDRTYRVLTVMLPSDY